MKNLRVFSAILAAAVMTVSCDGLYSDVIGKDIMFINIEHWIKPLYLYNYLDSAGTGTSATAPEVSLNDGGDVLITWLQPVGSYKHVFAMEWRGWFWQGSVDVSDIVNPSGLDASGQQSAMNGRGDTVVVWTQDTGANTYIYGREYRNGTWTSMGRIDSGSGSADNPRVAIDDSGNTVVVWGQDSLLGHQIYMKEYRGASWSSPVQISPGLLDAFMPRVAMDNNGTTVIAWSGYSDLLNRHVYRSEYRGGSWTHPAGLLAYIDPTTVYVQSASDVRIAMGDNGEAVITFIAKSDLTYYHVYRSEYRLGTSAWVNPVDMSADHIDPVGQSSSEPDIAMDRYGNTIIVWKQFDGMIYDRIYKSEYRKGVWTNPADLQHPIDASLPSGDSKEPRVAMDDTGNAVIIRSEVFGPSVQTHIFKAIFRNGAWHLSPKPAYDILDPFSSIYPNEKSELPRVAMGNNGWILVTWQGNIDATYTHIYLAEGFEGIFPIPW